MQMRLSMTSFPTLHPPTHEAIIAPHISSTFEGIKHNAQGACDILHITADTARQPDPGGATRGACMSIGALHRLEAQIGGDAVRFYDSVRRYSCDCGIAAALRAALPDASRSGSGCAAPLPVPLPSGSRLWGNLSAVCGRFCRIALADHPCRVRLCGGASACRCVSAAGADTSPR